MPGAYKLSCPCNPTATYIGRSIRPITTRGKEHQSQRAAAKGNWVHFGISQHKQFCKEQVKWEPEVITTMSNKNKRKPVFHQMNNDIRGGGGTNP